MIAGHESLTADERVEVLHDAAREAVHARPGYGEDFGCGLPGDTTWALVALWPDEVTCTGCCAAEKARRP